MISQNLISIIVPVYNVEKYLDRCVKSLINQTYKNIEILLIDDGSKDSSSEICDNWAKNDNRIKVVHKSNGGLSSARNVGLDMAKGDYIAFVDSDDYVAQDMYEILYNEVIEEDADIVCCGRYRVLKDRQYDIDVLPKKEVMTSSQAINYLLLGNIVNEAAWDKLYNAKLFEDKRFPLGEINEDIVLIITLLGECKKIVHVGKPLYYYCENIGSITKSGYTSKIKVVLKHLKEIEKYISENYIELTESCNILQARYTQNCLYLILGDDKIYKKYFDDYKAFYKVFQANFIIRVKSGNISRTEKIKGFLIYFKLYRIVHKIRI